MIPCYFMILMSTAYSEVSYYCSNNGDLVVSGEGKSVLADKKNAQSCRTFQPYDHHYAYFRGAITEVGENFCKDNTQLITVSFETNVSSFEIKNSAFQGCVKLTKITFPNNLKKIGELAFADSGLQSILFYSMTDSLIINSTNSKNSIFYNANSLQLVTICNATSHVNIKDTFVSPKLNLIVQAHTGFEQATFMGRYVNSCDEPEVCSQVNAIAPDYPKTPIYKFKQYNSDKIFSFDPKINKLSVTSNSTGTVTIPSSLQSPGNRTSYNEVETFKQYLTNGLADIQSLEIKIASGSASIIEKAFFGFQNLKEVYLASRKSIIRTNAFQKCVSLKNLYLENIDTIDIYSFDNTSLEKIVINPTSYISYVYISYYAFTSLKSAYVLFCDNSDQDKILDKFKEAKEIYVPLNFSKFSNSYIYVNTSNACSKAVEGVFDFSLIDLPATLPISLPPTPEYVQPIKLYHDPDSGGAAFFGIFFALITIGLFVVQIFYEGKDFGLNF